MPVHTEKSQVYSLDCRASQFTVQAFAEGISGVADHRPRFLITQYSGQARWDRARPGTSSVSVVVESASLDLIDDVSEKDRRQIDQVLFEGVLESSRFPKINFQSSRIAATALSENLHRLQITGLLTLHGVTSETSLECQLVLTDDTFRAYGEFHLRQTNHDINMTTVAGGLVRIKDELKFVFYIIGRRPE